MKAAKKPESPIQKSMATTHLIVDVILKKYDEHLPLYRQSKILERDGIIIPDNTLGNWVMGAAEVLSPLGEALWSQVAASSYVQADETTVKILYPDKKGYILHAPTNCIVPSKCWKLVVKSARNLFLYLFFSVERDFFKCFSSSSKLLNTVLATNVFLVNFHNRSMIFKFGDATGRNNSSIPSFLAEVSTYSVL